MSMPALDSVAAKSLGFAALGTNVRISDRASFYGAERIHIGNNVRIDDFCVLSAGLGGIYIGDNIHMAVYSSCIGRGRITLSDFCNISSRVSIYSSSDDYSGVVMTNPTVPERFTGVIHADVMIGRHVIIGSGSVVLPGVTVAEGAAVGALSLVRADCQAFGVYGGTPAKLLRDRKRDLLELEREFEEFRRLQP
jgi:acetyltransferase-like isoleucine patch superfamily enzyme